jgi:hypothetical protein
MPAIRLVHLVTDCDPGDPALAETLAQLALAQGFVETPGWRGSPARTAGTEGDDPGGRGEDDTRPRVLGGVGRNPE